MTSSVPDSPEMVDIHPPAWLTTFQREMGQILRTPLDTTTGRFRAVVEAYPPAFVAEVIDDGPGAVPRLQLYHEQYWRRLFNTLQETFPRTARAVGYFWFNALASRFLEMFPPQSYDMANVSEGFFSWTMRALDELSPPNHSEAESGGHRVIDTPLRMLPQSGTRSPAAAVLASVTTPWSFVAQALHVDEAERRAFRATCEPLWNPTARERAELWDRRLRYAPSFSLLRLDYDLPLGKLSEGTTFSSERRKTPTHLVILRSSRAIATHPIDPIFARLLALARINRLGEAMARTEKALPPALREHLRRSMDGYIDTSLTKGYWIGAIP